MYRMELNEIKCTVCPYQQSKDEVRMEFAQFLWEKGYLKEATIGIDFAKEFRKEQKND